MERIFILSGSDMGDKARNLSLAATFLEEEIKGAGYKFDNLVMSSVMESEPWGFESQEIFLNQIISFCSDISPEGLLMLCQRVEQRLGRDEKPRYDAMDRRIYHSRIIDMDILFYGEKIIETENLTIPHPLLHQRLFALNPMAEIAPDFIHPVLKKTINELFSYS